jgi:hypothetical protein
MGIEKDDKDKVKKLTGYNYTSQFLEYLRSRNIMNKNGTSYSKSHVRWYFSNKTNGSNPLDVLFIEFWEAISEENKSNAERIQKLSDNTSEILND